MTLTYPNRIFIINSKYLYVVCEANNVEKPGAVIPHAGICEGAVGQLAVLPRLRCFPFSVLRVIVTKTVGGFLFVKGLAKNRDVISCAS
jgi:hypothetical protein